MKGKLTGNDELHGVLSSGSGTLSGTISSGSSALRGTMSGGGGTYDYNSLRNLPQINGVELKGSKTSEDLSLPKVLFNTTEDWNSNPTLISEKNTIYVYTDYQETEDGHSLAGFKIGDGLAYLIDLPFNDTFVEQHMSDGTIHVTAAEKEFWNNKNRAYTIEENLILTNL